MNIFKKFIPLCLCLSMICTLFGFQTVEGAIAYDETISNGSFSDFQQALLNAKTKVLLIIFIKYILQRI